MVVAITPNLKELGEGLEDIGYTIVMLGSYNYPIDAMLYTGYSGDVSYITMNNIPAHEHSTTNYGILMVNAENKTLEEIDRILKTRVYSPLF